MLERLYWRPFDLWLLLTLTSHHVSDQDDERQSGALLLEDGLDGSDESESEGDARQQVPRTREAAWVDEDDEQEEE